MTTNADSGSRAIPNSAPIIANPPGDHPFQTILRHVDLLVDKNGWDQPTRLFYVIDEPGFAFEGMSAIGLVEMELPDGIGKSYPPRMLEEFAMALLRIPAARKMVDWRKWRGFIVSFETWSTRIPDDPAELARLQDDRVSHQIHTRPDAQENRITYGSFGPNGEFGILRRRGGEEPIESNRDSAIGGRVPEALKRMVLAGMILSLQAKAQ